ncbi:hypothetical protein FOZ62_007886 [Perkinsus olseni]|uniref:Uncharacterized protein n=1 Tax=Perkinsus olseni TaxID=32597 RepID=A0A7J6SPG1_PEROL|nr:hypothetical protein FOZ62_007886 [Perkinsus olseni]
MSVSQPFENSKRVVSEAPCCQQQTVGRPCRRHSCCHMLSRSGRRLFNAAVSSSSSSITGGSSAVARPPTHHRIDPASIEVAYPKALGGIIHKELLLVHQCSEAFRTASFGHP